MVNRLKHASGPILTIQPLHLYVTGFPYEVNLKILILLSLFEMHKGVSTIYTLILQIQNDYFNLK